MNAERANKHLNEAIDNLEKARSQLDYLRSDLTGTPFAEKVNALAARLDPFKKDVSAMIREIENAARRKP